MFGVLITGRLVQTDFQQISETQFVCNIPDADNVNHVVVFMTGQMPFPDDMGGAVYFSWPSAEGPTWHLLGHLTNAKPSTIFKVANLKQGIEGSSFHPFGLIQNHQSHMMQIGIAVEPLHILAQQTPAAGTTVSSANSYNDFCTKMLENCFNFISSFAVTQSQMVPNPSESFVPLSSLQQWFTNFQRRLAQNPNFWKS